MLAAQLLEFGVGGTDIITDNAAHDLNYYRIQAVGATVIAELDADNIFVNGVVGASNRKTALSLADGAVLYGRITHIKLTSGALYANKLPTGVAL